MPGHAAREDGLSARLGSIKSPVVPHQRQTVEHAKAGFMDSFSSGIWPDYTTFPREKWAETISKSPEDLKDLECRIKCGSQTMDLMSCMYARYSFMHLDQYGGTFDKRCCDSQCVTFHRGI